MELWHGILAVVIIAVAAVVIFTDAPQRAGEILEDINEMFSDLDNG